MLARHVNRESDMYQKSRLTLGDRSKCVCVSALVTYPEQMTAQSFYRYKNGAVLHFFSALITKGTFHSNRKMV